MIEVPSKSDYESLANKHNELVELVKSVSTNLGTIQEELDQMPSGYRNSLDIKNLKGRIERLEYANNRRYIETGDTERFESNEKRIKQLEESGMRLADRFNAYGTDEFVRELGGRVLKMEECCKNTVASGKALEERVNNIGDNVNKMYGDLQQSKAQAFRAQKFMDKLREL